MSARSHAISLDDLLAFNDELRAIIRSGIPLECGLQALGPDLPGKLRYLVAAISQRLERGESLVEVLRDKNLALPPVYSAVVAAGVRAGRLPSALESMSRSVQRAAELRRTLIASLIYPVLVFLIASAVFAVTWLKLFPVMRELVPSMLEQRMPSWFHWLTWTADHGFVWMFAVWATILIGGGIWWLRSQQALQFGRGRWLPSLSAVNAAGRTAAFAETLALLAEQHVPMDEALSLAGAASGDRRLQLTADALATRIRSGGSEVKTPQGLPPLLTWLILTKSPTHHLVRTLRQTAASERDRALRNSLLLSVYLPIVLSAVVGAVVALYYVTLVLMPFYYLMYQLGQP